MITLIFNHLHYQTTSIKLRNLQSNKKANIIFTNYWKSYLQKSVSLFCATYLNNFTFMEHTISTKVKVF